MELMCKEIVFLVVVTSSFITLWFNSIYHDLIINMFNLKENKLFNCVLCSSFWIALPLFYFVFGLSFNMLSFIVVPILATYLDKQINSL